MFACWWGVVSTSGVLWHHASLACTVQLLSKLEGKG